MHFALTEAILDRTMPITFYAFCLAAIYGLLRARERYLLNSPVQRKKTLSVIIIAKNEADRIGPCLESVKGWAEEIVVLDSGSTDTTVSIAKKYTDKVFKTDWPGFGIQKQRALEKATCEWVLSLDADEVVSDELRNEIDSELTEKPAYDGYRVPRPIIVFGKQLDYGVSWQAPIRLCERKKSRFTDAPVHEKIVISGGKITTMRGALFHETYRDYGHALEKYNQYAWLQASARWGSGRRSSLIGAFLRALFNFFHNFIGKAGFLDGQHGFLMACLNAQYTFHKYAVLWAKKAEGKT